MTSADRIENVLNEKSKKEYPQNESKKVDNCNTAVEFKDVTFTYSGAGASSL